MAKNALAGRYKAIRREESAELGIVVAGLEVIKTESLVEYIATVTEGIMQAKCAGHCVACDLNVSLILTIPRNSKIDKS